MKPLFIITLAALLIAGAVGTASADPITGDFNQNGRLDFADIVGLFNYLGGDAPYLPHMDMNQNGRLDFADVVLLWKAL